MRKFIIRLYIGLSASGLIANVIFLSVSYTREEYSKGVLHLLIAVLCSIGLAIAISDEKGYL